MRVTRLGPPRIPRDTLILGGEVFTAETLSGVRRITSNGSNILQNPYINFASGSNVIFSVASNTLTIHSTGGGGSGSLTTQDEGGTLSSAVTTLNFTGAGVTASGGGATTTVNVPGGGGFTHAYVGTNAIGGSTETITDLRQYMQKVTLANDCMVASIGAYVKQISAGQILSMAVGILDDDSNSPDHVIALNVASSPTTFLSDNNAVAGDARWVHMALGVWLTAGDYWLAMMFSLVGASHQVYYDAGSDQIFANAAWRLTDAGWASVTDSTRKYSIRASTIR